MSDTSRNTAVTVERPGPNPEWRAGRRSADDFKKLQLTSNQALYELGQHR